MRKSTLSFYSFNKSKEGVGVGVAGIVLGFCFGCLFSLFCLVSKGWGRKWLLNVFWGFVFTSSSRDIIAWQPLGVMRLMTAMRNIYSNHDRLTPRKLWKIADFSHKIYTSSFLTVSQELFIFKVRYDRPFNFQSYRFFPKKKIC